MIGAVLAVRTSSLEPATGQHHSWLFTGAPSAQVALRCSWLLPQGSARANRLHCPSRCRLLPLSLASQLAAKLHPTATAISNIRLYQLNARSAPSCTPTSTPAVPQLSKPDVQQSIAAGCLSTTPMMSTLLGSFIQHAFWGYAQVGSFRLHSSNAATLPTYHSQYVVHALSSLWGGGGQGKCHQHCGPVTDGRQGLHYLHSLSLILGAASIQQSALSHQQASTVTTWFTALSH